MRIALRIDGKEKEFKVDFISGRMFRRTIEMQKLFRQRDDGKTVVDEAHLDSMVDYVVELFGRQFDRDQFYDGIDARKMLPTIVACINEVVSGASEAVGADPNDPNLRPAQ